MCSINQAAFRCICINKREEELVTMKEDINLSEVLQNIIRQSEMEEIETTEEAIEQLIQQLG
ncbi:hypothetical protein GCM10007216_15330 [Thalassobacillus devorans]|uniref:Uncharacterized protein n=1 Tax=Thalassobacillus devorans TaxID=279813 RepID=A0ABQ1NUW1_9BACI|nr:hypothetical protein GCM10007216_15330 [Thalassobacillus devorans]